MILNLCSDCGVVFERSTADVANRCRSCADTREAWAVALERRMRAEVGEAFTQAKASLRLPRLRKEVA